MNGPTGQEFVGMIASQAESSSRHAAEQRYEAAGIIEKWVPAPDDLSAMDPETMSQVITDLVAAVRVLSGLPAYETPAEHWRRNN